ncbi:diguanylate cyclase [Roseateles sp.]|uniref:diguanylate cyclase n=1 Tax=Roseateles sp. TaxID=1971397 RepID=UPI003BA61CE4
MGSSPGLPQAAEIYRRRLQLHGLYERYSEMQEVLLELEGRAEFASDANLQIERRLAQSRIDRAKGKAAEAARVLEPLRYKASNIADPAVRLAAQLALGEVDGELGQNGDATLALTQLIEDAKQMERTDLVAEAWIALAALQLGMGDYQQALHYHKEALKQAPDWALQTQTKARMGIAQMTNMVGSRSEAFELLAPVLMQFRESQNVKGEADALLLKGFFLSRNKQHQASLQPLQQALALRESLKHESGVINSLTHLCSALVDVGRLEEGAQMCLAAANRAELTDSPAMQWDAQAELADAYAALGQFKLAYRHLKRSERALLEHSRLDLIGKTAAIREKFETDRQRLQNEQLSARLAYEEREQHRLMIGLLVSGVLLALLTAAGFMMTKLYWKARGLAQVDGLTGLLNRRRLMELAEIEFEKSRRYGSPLAVISLDLDHFKQINDEHGHAVGDQVLKKMAALCREALRHGDLAGRSGGEEFLLFLPHADTDAALHLAERLRLLFEQQLQFAPELPVTASFGVAVYEPGIGLAEMLQKADKAMYAAKADGRNQVRLAGDAARARPGGMNELSRDAQLA